MVRRAFELKDDFDTIIFELEKGECEFWTLKCDEQIRGHAITRLEVRGDYRELVVVAIQGKGIMIPPFFQMAKDIAKCCGAKTIRMHPINSAVKRLHKRYGADVTNDEYSILSV